MAVELVNDGPVTVLLEVWWPTRSHRPGARAGDAGSPAAARAGVDSPGRGGRAPRRAAGAEPARTRTRRCGRAGGLRPDELGAASLDREWCASWSCAARSTSSPPTDCLRLRPLVQPVLDAEMARHSEYRARLAGLDLDPVLAFGRPFLAEPPRRCGQLRAALAEALPRPRPRRLGLACRNRLGLVQVPPRGRVGQDRRGARRPRPRRGWDAPIDARPDDRRAGAALPRRLRSGDGRRRGRWSRLTGLRRGARAAAAAAADLPRRAGPRAVRPPRRAAPRSRHPGAAPASCPSTTTCCCPTPDRSRFGGVRHGVARPPASRASSWPTARARGTWTVEDGVLVVRCRASRRPRSKRRASRSVRFLLGGERPRSACTRSEATPRPGWWRFRRGRLVRAGAGPRRARARRRRRGHGSHCWLRALVGRDRCRVRYLVDPSRWSRVRLARALRATGGVLLPDVPTGAHPAALAVTARSRHRRTHRVGRRHTGPASLVLSPTRRPARPRPRRRRCAAAARTTSRRPGPATPGRRRASHRGRRTTSCRCGARSRPAAPPAR